MTTMLFNFIENLLWVTMFMVLWPPELKNIKRVMYSFCLAAILAFVQTMKGI